MSISRDRILYEDDHLIAVNKLSAELVVKGKGKVEKLPLFDFLKQDYPGLRSVHRLDFETSGVVVFARTKEVYERITETNFAGWKKVYTALVMGRINRKMGVIRMPLPARTGKGTVEAHTEYKVIERFANSSLVEAAIETGRHHQIRKHFAFIKHPLVLDHVYGHERFNKVFTQEFGYRRFFLHAARIECTHPITGEPLTIEAPLPKPFTAVVKRLQEI
jgi:RluA family pseudouridine synthase